MKSVFIFLLLFVAFGIFNFITVVPVIYYGTQDIITAKVIDKEIKIRGTQKDELYFIKTDKEVLQDSTKSVFIKDSGSRIYPIIEKGKIYKFLVYGFEIPFLTLYRNILKAEEEK